MRFRETRRARQAIGAALATLALAAWACGRAAGPTQVGELGGGGAATQGVSVVATQPPALSSPTSPAIYSLGDTVHLGDWNLAVLGWSQPPGSAGNTPRPGQRFVAVEVVFVNVAQGSRNLSPLMQMSLKDAGDRRYTLNLAAQAAAGSALPNGEVSPGERVRGWVGFQVPQDAGGLRFIFDPSLLNSGKVVVALGAQPASVGEPAGLMPGEQGQSAFGVGDVVAIGDLQVVVHGLRQDPGTAIFHPDAGDQFVAVDVSVTNTGASPRTISSLLQMKLKDASGQSYDLHLGAQAAAGASPPDGELSPGETVRGQVAYQVPADVGGLLFVFDPNLAGFGKVTVALP